MGMAHRVGVRMGMAHRVGGALLAAGLSGFTVLLAWPEPPPEMSIEVAGRSVRAASPLAGWDDPRIVRRSDETPMAFAARATRNIFYATYACMPTRYAQSAAAWLAARQLGSEIMAHGYLDASIVRCGFCHQRAFLRANALERAGIEDAEVFGLNGHVVTRFQLNGQSYFADPDYGVGPFPAQPGALAATVRRVYAEYENVNEMVGIYANEADSAPYESMLWLRTLAEHQRRATARIAMALHAAVAVLIAAGLLLLTAHRLRGLLSASRRAASRKNAEAEGAAC